MKLTTARHIAYPALAALFCIASCKQRTTATYPTTPAFPAVVYQKEKMAPGLTLVTNYRGQSTLINTQGQTVKKFAAGLVATDTTGNYVGIANETLVKYNARDQLLWQAQVSGTPHHSVSLNEQGQVAVLGCETHKLLGLPLRFDVIQIFSAQGKLLYTWSVYEHLQEFISMVSKSKWLSHLPKPYTACKNIQEYLLQDPAAFIYPTDGECNNLFEFTHFTSAMFIADNNLATQLPAFKKGNLLVCFNPYSAYGIINPVTGKIEWVGYLPQRSRLHSPQLTSAGTILVFQNNTDTIFWANKNYPDSLRTIFEKQFPGGAQKHHPAGGLPFALAVEYNPINNTEIWRYPSAVGKPITAPHMGNAQRLSNGNTLICFSNQTNGGTVTEVTPLGETVWQYIPPPENATSQTPVNLYSAWRVNQTMLNQLKHEP